MPNHVTNVINASKEVISSMLNADGRVDFCIIIPRHDDLLLNGANGVLGDAEIAAQAICKEPAHEHSLIAMLERENHQKVSALEMSDEAFEQFVMMVRNKRKHGFYHMMDYARSAWGTKWNAYECEVKENQAKFDTAWSHPAPVIMALSKSHPDQVISVEYADEDTGSNCGKYTIKNGSVISSDIAPSWGDQTDQEKSKWSEFSIKLRYGRDAKPEDFDRDENWNYIEQ